MRWQWTTQMKWVKVVLVASAVIIAGVSLVVSNALIKDLSHEEQGRMEIWAEAMRSLVKADQNTDLNLVLEVIYGNNTIPVIVQDMQGRVTTFRNIELMAKTASDSLIELRERAAAMQKKGMAMRMTLSPDEKPSSSDILICYDESLMLKRLSTYPYVQLGVVGLFVVVAIFALLSSKRAEQNKVWVGLSKETAHQLGTPISSLMAWCEILKETYPDDELIPELRGDVKRLELIAERFSKIGSQPELSETSLPATIERVAKYIGRRASDKVLLTTSFPAEDVRVNICAPLFEWVIENLCKNAIDAMSGSGKISIFVKTLGERVVVDITDTGKGIKPRDFRNVFKPGYTTKKRGWGLGLSLAKRIVEEYHKGSIFVKESVPGVGTTFEIILKR